MEGFLLGKVDVKMIEGFVCTVFGMSKNQKDVYKPFINVLIKRALARMGFESIVREVQTYLEHTHW